MGKKNNQFKNVLRPVEGLKGNGSAKKSFSLDEREQESITSTSLEYNLKLKFEMLSPLEQKVITFIRSKTSGSSHGSLGAVLVGNNDLLEASGADRFVLNNVIWKLKNKNILEIISSKKGPSGHRLFKVNQWLQKNPSEQQS